MSVWNTAYEDFRRPYYEEEKKSKKDYDGDGKVESGSKEHAGAVHNAIQRAKGGKPDGQDTRKEEIEVEEGYKEIDKKKENKMYRRAGNLARTALSSKGKKKEDAMNKSGKIVSAIARQKENERFSKMGDEKARSNYKEENEIEEGMKQARKNVGASTCWDGYKAQGTKKKDGKEVPNCVKEDEVAEGYGKKKKKMKKEHADWRAEMGFIDEASCGSDKPKEKKGVKNKITVMPEVKTEETVVIEKKVCPKCEGKGCNHCDSKGYHAEEITDLEEKRGLYANIHAKRARGEAPAKPGDEDYPAKDAFKKAAKTAKKEEVEFAGNYEGPLYAPHPDLANENLQQAVDSITKKGQNALRKIGVKINDTPRPTARPSATTSNTIRQNMKSNEEVELDEKFKTQYGDKTKLSQSSKRKSLGRGSSIKDGAKKSGYESPKEFRDSEKKLAPYKESLLDKVLKTYVSEEDYDRMKDRRMERGGVDGSNRYDRSPKSNTKKFGSGKTMAQKELEKKHGKGASAMDIVRAEIMKKHGKGAIMDKKKKDN